MNQTFKNTSTQNEAIRRMIKPEVSKVLLVGGSRSGKTAINLKAIIIRAIKEPNSRHLVCRFAFAHAKQSIWHDSLQAIHEKAFPELKWTENKQDWFIELPNGSTIWLGGLDDKERTDKILGNEYSTIYFNECSQISYKSIETALTRLAQKNGLKPLALFDENPPSKRHWSYKLFIEKKNPIDNSDLMFPASYDYLYMNPDDNRANLPENYIEETLMGMSKKSKERFLYGRFQDANENALFTDVDISENRVTVSEIPIFERVVIGLDPATTSNDGSDETGIIGAGKANGHYYVLKDLSGKFTPSGWGNVVCDEYKANRINRIIAETNQGGEMVESILTNIIHTIPVTKVHAKIGKALRADPVAALYERGLVHHVGLFEKLEDEMTEWDGTGASPNRLDALVYALLALSNDPIIKPAKFNF